VYSKIWYLCVLVYVLRWIWCLWCYSECASTPGKLKSLLGHGGNRTRDLWDTIVFSLPGVDATFQGYYFSACPVWMHTQSNIANIMSLLCTFDDNQLAIILYATINIILSNCSFVLTRHFVWINEPV
jgi:hypothetical protein